MPALDSAQDFEIPPFGRNDSATTYRHSRPFSTVIPTKVGIQTQKTSCKSCISLSESVPRVF